MARTELPWLLWGRLVRPFPLAASLACANLAALIIAGRSVWGNETDEWSQATAALALAATVLLWAGWWARSSTLMAHGLMACTVLFTMRGFYIGMVGDNWLTAGLSLAWAAAAAGAWLLERTATHTAWMADRRHGDAEAQ